MFGVDSSSRFLEHGQTNKQKKTDKHTEYRRDWAPYPRLRLYSRRG